MKGLKASGKRGKEGERRQDGGREDGEDGGCVGMCGHVVGGFVCVWVICVWVCGWEVC